MDRILSKVGTQYPPTTSSTAAEPVSYVKLDLWRHLAEFLELLEPSACVKVSELH